MTKTYILPLSNHLATLENVGGKGMSLSKLIMAGIPVPDGFNITTDAYRLYVEHNGIGSRIAALLDVKDPNDIAVLETESQKIARLFEAGAIPKELEKTILSAYAAMKGVPVAVRSSATAEDLPEASFAGQQETYLNIQGDEAVLSAIKQCWASLWTARAISYRLLHGIDQDCVALAVVVQKLVFSDASGVMFTANPTNGRRGEILINAAWGLGEAVVSSLVTPDTAVVDKAFGKIVSLDIADKQVMTVRAAEGSKEQSVDMPMRKKPSLTKEQIMSLAELGKRIESHYGMPMDVEWAMEKGKLYIVQARPITVLPPEWKPPEEGIYYNKGSLAEHLPGPVTPLFATFGLEHVNKAAQILWTHMFGRSMPKLWPSDGAYTVINGYVYFSCAYKPFLIMVKSLSPRSLREGMRNSVPRYEAAQKAFAAEVAYWEEIKPEALSTMELLDSAGKLFDAACTYFTKIQLCLPSAMSSESLFRKFFLKTTERSGINDMSVFLVGFETVALKAEKSLYQIAEWTNQHPELTTYVDQTPVKRVEEDFSLPNPPGAISPVVWREWKEMILVHQKEYGRTCYEYDFASPTPLEERLPVLESIKMFVSGEGKNPFIRQAKAVRKRDAATAAVLKNIGGLRKWLFQKLLGWAQETGTMREDAIFYMGMGHPLIRYILREIGCRLVAGGAITQPDDIYWLEKRELEALAGDLDAGAPLSNMTPVIPPRRKELEQNQRFASPNTLPEKSKSLTRNTIPIRKDGKLILTGIGTSAGVVTSRACILHGPADFEKFQPGDVLVAVTTTPAWTPLFASAGAVVTDIGGPLSHSSIVAREYGIPAVMAAHSATLSIRAGQMVTVDGGEGTVTIHE